jgi:hypothetical protein
VPAHASRFAAHLAALSSGALSVIFTLTLAPAAAAWVVLGLAAFAVLAALAAFAVPGQGGGPRAVEILVVLEGTWMIVAARVFSDPSVTKWLGFADGVALWTLGGLGLIVHERLIERRLRRLVEAERYRLAMTHRPAPEPGRFDRAEH